MTTPETHSGIDRLNAEAWALRFSDTKRSIELAGYAEQMAKGGDG